MRDTRANVAGMPPGPWQEVGTEREGAMPQGGPWKPDGLNGHTGIDDVLSQVLAHSTPESQTVLCVNALLLHGWLMHYKRPLRRRLSRMIRLPILLPFGGYGDGERDG